MASNTGPGRQSLCSKSRICPCMPVPTLLLLQNRQRMQSLKAVRAAADAEPTIGQEDEALGLV